MKKFEYQVVPVPTAVAKAGLFRKVGEQATDGMVTIMNDLGNAGWEFVRNEEIETCRRRRFGGIEFSGQQVMVFRRLLEEYECPADVARAVRTEKIASQNETATSRRVSNHEAVEMVKAGKRSIRPHLNVVPLVLGVEQQITLAD